MKKIVSLVLALSMIMTVSFVVNAENTSNEGSVSAYKEFTAAEAVNFAGANYSTNAGCYSMSSGTKLVLYRNVDFGNISANKIKLFASNTAGASGMMRLYLVRPEDDIYVDEKGYLSDKYVLNSNTFKEVASGNTVQVTMGHQFTATKSWQKEEFVFDFADSYYTGGPVSGVYNVYIGLDKGNFYGMQFEGLGLEPKSAYEEFTAAEAINFAGATYSTNAGCYSMSSGTRMVLFRNVDFGNLGSEQVKLFASNTAGASGMMRLYLVRPEDDIYVDEKGYLSDKYVLNSNTFKEVASGNTVQVTMGHQFTATKSWQKEEFVFDFADSYYTGGPVSGVYNVYIGLDKGNFYGMQFVERTPLNAWEDSFSGLNYTGKTTYPGVNTTIGTLNKWGDSWDDGAEKRYAMWYADFGSEEKLATVDVYYGIAEQWANCYVTLYADEIGEDNIIARGVLTYQESMDWATTDKYMTLPVKKTLTGVHKIYLSVEESPYLTESNPAGNIVKFVFNNADNYTRINSTYGNEEHSSLIFNKENENTVFHALAIYRNDKLIDAAVKVITPAEGLNSSELSVSTENIEAGYTVKTFVWDYETLAPLE